MPKNTTAIQSEYTMDNNEQQWITMDNNGQQWTTTDNNGQQSSVHASVMPFLIHFICLLRMSQRHAAETGLLAMSVIV